MAAYQEYFAGNLTDYQHPREEIDAALERGAPGMAKCDEGYRCEVCGDDVDGIAESDLYLRYVIGMVDPETLHTQPERHIRCNPTLAQFVVDEGFEPVVVEGPFDKRQLDAEFVEQREELVTRGWRRLQELSGRAETAIINYPIPEVRERLRREAGEY
jgi:hypothetical protein